MTGALDPGPDGRLVVDVTGLDLWGDAAVTVSGPGGFQRMVVRTDTLTSLVQGAYLVMAGEVAFGGHTWLPTPATQTASLVGAGAMTVATVAYVRQRASLTLTATGLPTGADAVFSVIGPGGFDSTIAGGATFDGLDPGTYAVTAQDVAWAGDTWRPVVATRTVPLAAGDSAVISVPYAIATGGLTVTVLGLPPETDAGIEITGPGGFGRTVIATTAFVGLEPGAYAVVASPVTSNGYSWHPSAASQGATVTAGTTPTAVTITYALATGAIALTVTGLPDSLPAAVTVAGPDGYHRTLAGSSTLVDLAPGGYTVTAASVAGAGGTWVAAPASQSLSVTASLVPVAVAVQYSPGVGSLAVSIAGLPAGSAAAVTVSGPSGYRQTLATSRTLTGLPPGNYTVVAGAIVLAGQTWAPVPPSQTVAVVAAGTAAAAVTYAVAQAATLNLRIDGANLTQATQRYDGTVPLVAGRDAYLRVFVLASEANAVAPAVRVRLYSGGSLVQTYMLPAVAAGVPLSVNQGSLAASWNVRVPGALVQPNLRVLTDVDPGHTVPEANELDNTFPASGSPAAVDVRALPTLNVRFIPVLQQVNGRQGAVSNATREQYLADVKRLLPVGGYDADVRLPYTTTAPALQSDNANGAWGTILSEVLALRSADGSTRYYYGVVNTSYSSGVAGIGYVGGSARTALGWDRLPGGSEVMAHELGHNMGRSHAPCGGAGEPDPSFPYAGGMIGVWGLDVAALALKSPAAYADLMGYCSPDWISDYNWQAMVSYRQAGPNNTPPAADSRGGLLVWGRITPAGPVLEPAFFVDAPALLPGGGPHRLDLTGTDGATLMSVSFAAADIADTPTGPEQAFAFVVPVSSVVAGRLGGLRLVTGGRMATRRAGAADRDPATVLSRGPGGEVVIRWDADRYPMVLVRDGATGQILSFARGGEIRLRSLGGSVRLNYSDGVRSRQETRTFR